MHTIGHNNTCLRALRGRQPPQRWRVSALGQIGQSARIPESVVSNFHFQLTGWISQLLLIDAALSCVCVCVCEHTSQQVSRCAQVATDYQLATFVRRWKKVRH